MLPCEYKVFSTLNYLFQHTYLVYSKQRNNTENNIPMISFVDLWLYQNNSIIIMVIILVCRWQGSPWESNATQQRPELSRNACDGWIHLSMEKGN